MPLYWYTDKIIGEKYRLKKPIPIKNIGYTKWLSGYLEINGQKIGEITFDITILNKTFEVENFDEFEELVIDELEESLNIDDKFLEQFKEYLEEVK